MDINAHLVWLGLMIIHEYALSQVTSLSEVVIQSQNGNDHLQTGKNKDKP